MKGAARPTEATWSMGFLIALALVLSLLIPAEAAAQEADDGMTVALSEVPSTGGRRLGPVVLASSRVPRPAKLEGFIPVEL